MKRVLAFLIALFCVVHVPALAAPPVALQDPGFEDGGSGWSIPPSFRVVSDAAHSGSHSLRQINANTASYELASLTVPFTHGQSYRFGAWVRTRGVKGDETGATICVEWYGPGGYIGGAYPAGRKGDNDWFHVEDITAPIPDEATRVTLDLYLRKGMTGTAWYDDVTVAPYEPPFSAALVQPAYRETLWESDREQPITVTAHVPKEVADTPTAGATIVCEITRDNRTWMTASLQNPDPGDHELSLSATRLPPGAYRLAVALRSPDGRRLAAQEFALRKLPRRAPRPAVYVDSHKRLIVRGKPFFPIGLYFGPGPTDAGFRTHIDRVAASPFNTIMPYGINSGSIAAIRTYLDYLNARGVKILYSIKDNFAGTGGYADPLLGFHGEEGITRGIIGMFRTHPAVIGWYVNDELSLDMRDRLEARYRLIREIDPDHPTWAVLYQVAQIAGYLGTADVLGSDPYPIPDGKVTTTADWTRATAAASSGYRAVWEVPQIFDWACYKGEKAAKLRPPTLDEMLVMSYLALIQGADGLIYYSYFDLLRDRQGFDKRWADVLLVGAEVKRLTPALLSVRKAPRLSVHATGSAVRWSVRSDDAGDAYVLLANTDSNATASVRVDVPARAHLKLLRRGQEESIAGGTPCAITLPPLSAATLIVGR